MFAFASPSALVLAGLALGCAWTPALASVRLSCEIQQGGTTQTLQFEPVSDPYLVRSININDRFRFKAVMVGTADHADYVNVYAYAWSSGKAVLLHEAHYLAPVALPPTSEQASPHALTGRHFLYSPDLGREMQYGCALREVAP